MSLWGSKYPCRLEAPKSSISGRQKHRKIISVVIVSKYPPKQHIQNETKYLLPIFFYNPGNMVKVAKLTKFARMMNDTIFFTNLGLLNLIITLF